MNGEVKRLIVHFGSPEKMCAAIATLSLSEVRGCCVDPQAAREVLSFARRSQSGKARLAQVISFDEQVAVLRWLSSFNQTQLVSETVGSLTEKWQAEKVL